MYNFYITFQRSQVFKKHYAVCCDICSDCAVTATHLSTLVLTASEYAVTIEINYFYFYPAVSESIHI
jgi:hypothetical protein